MGFLRWRWGSGRLSVDFPVGSLFLQEVLRCWDVNGCHGNRCAAAGAEGVCFCSARPQPPQGV